MTAGRAGLVAAALVLGGLLVTAVVVATPWRPLGAVPAQDRVAPTVAGDFTAAEHAREDAFHRAVRPPAYLGLAAGIAVVVLLGLTPLGARLVTLLGRPLGGGWVRTVLLGGLAVALVQRLVTLPFAAWSETVLRRYGLSTRGWSGWLGDVARSWAVSTVLLLVVLVALVGLARRLPRTWWVPGALAAAALVVVASFLYPVVVEPLFNRFTPMAPGPLRNELLDLARRDGVTVDDVLVADASRRTTSLNAYVSGFGSTRRIVVYDTLLAEPRAQVEQVVAHELGHVKHRDVVAGTLLGALAAAFGVTLLALALGWPPLLRAAGATGPADPRVVPLVMALVAVGGLLLLPAQNIVSRRIEARADVHALDLTRDPQAFAEMQRSLALRGLGDLDPNPAVYALFASHPTGPQRIAMARTWATLHGVAAPGPLAPGAGTPR